MVTYVDDSGPSPPALVDVKSRRPSRYDERWDWAIIAAMRRGFIFNIVFPKEGVKYPRSLKEWEVRTPCSKCKKLSTDYRICSECGEVIFPFTIVDAHFKLKELIKKLRDARKQIG